MHLRFTCDIAGETPKPGAAIDRYLTASIAIALHGVGDLGQQLARPF
jgi:hypothetical protein